MNGAGSQTRPTKALTRLPKAQVADFERGAWTEVGNGTSLRAGSKGDWSCITQNCHVVWTRIGKMCSIANAVRIIPGNHPAWRAMQQIAVWD